MGGPRSQRVDEPALAAARETSAGMTEQAGELPPRPGQRRCPGRGAGLQRATWRSADMLYGLRLIDRLPSAGRNFRTGKTGNLAQLAPGAKKRVVRYRLNGEAR